MPTAEINLHLKSGCLCAFGVTLRGFALALLWCAVVLSGCRADHSSEAAGRLVARAAQLRAVGDARGAQAALVEALRQRPDDPKALEALGRLQLLDFSEPDAALASLRRAVAVAPADPEAHYGLGQQLHVRGDIAAARAEFAAALRLRPVWSHAAAWLGATELESLPADLPSATRHLEAAVRVDPHYAFARYQLGRAYGREGRWEEATASLQTCISLNSAYREAYYALGQALEHAGRREAARATLERFSELDAARRARRSRDVRRHAGAVDFE